LLLRFARSQGSERDLTGVLGGRQAIGGCSIPRGRFEFYCPTVNVFNLFAKLSFGGGEPPLEDGCHHRPVTTDQALMNFGVMGIL